MSKLYIRAGLYFLAGAFIFLSPLAIYADGMVITRTDPFENRWDFSAESSQQAFINYEKGRENMLISIGLSAALKDSLWLFPIPAEPQKVEVDILAYLPEISGEEVSKKANLHLDKAKRYSFNSQLYPLFFNNIQRRTSSIGGSFGETGLSLWGSVPSAIENDVQVYQHIEKEGMTSEIVSAKTADGLYQYLKDKSLQIDEGSIPVLDSYIGRDYSFIVSWISPESNVAGLEIERGVFVSFPTDRLYFPLQPTSVYGEVSVPADIRVIGHVTPDFPESLEQYSSVGYYIGDYDARTVDLENAEKFYDGKKTNVSYTRISINAPSSQLSDDLWMKRSSSLQTKFSAFIAKSFPVTFGILFLLASLLASLLAGFIAWPDMRSKPRQLIALGIANCLSIIGLIIAVIFYRKEPTGTVDTKLVSELKQAGYVRINKSKISFIILFTILFMLLSYGLYKATSALVIESSNQYQSYQPVRPVIDDIYFEEEAPSNPLIPQIEEKTILTPEEKAAVLTKIEDPIVWFTMDEGLGNSLANNGILKNAAQLGGTPYWLSGEKCISGSCLEFGSGYAQFYFPQLQSYSVSLWVNQTLSQVGERQILSATADSLGLTVYNDKSFLFFDGSILKSKTKLKNGTFYHVVITNDGSKKNIYVDGKLEGSSSTSIYGLPKPGKARLGSTADSVERLFAGVIDDLRIYNYSLSAKEVKTLYDKHGK